MEKFFLFLSHSLHAANLAFLQYSRRQRATTMKFMQNKFLLNSMKENFFFFLLILFLVRMCVDEAQSEVRNLLSENYDAMHVQNI